MKNIYLILLTLFACSAFTFAGDVTLTIIPNTTDVIDGREILWVSSTGATGRQALAADELVWVHADLDPGQTLTYVAYAYNENGYSPPSAQVSAPLNPKSTPPSNTIPVPIHIAPVMPVSPGMSISCTGNIQCDVN